MQFPERDLFLRGVRAFIGFKQTGVDYVRPERMFGCSTNNLLKNIGWAKKHILAYTTVLLSAWFPSAQRPVAYPVADRRPDSRPPVPA